MNMYRIDGKKANKKKRKGEEETLTLVIIAKLSSIWRQRDKKKRCALLIKVNFADRMNSNRFGNISQAIYDDGMGYNAMPLCQNVCVEWGLHRTFFLAHNHLILFLEKQAILLGPIWKSENFSIHGTGA